MLITKNKEVLWVAKRLRPFLRLHLLSYLCVVLSSGLALLDPLFVRLLIDRVIPQGKVSWLVPVAAGFFLTYALRFGLDSLAGTLNFRSAQMFAFKLRLSLVRKLHRLSMAYHDRNSAGESLHRLQTDVEQVATLSSEVFPSLLRLCVTFCIAISIMTKLNYKLTLLVIPLIPIFLITRSMFHRRLSEASNLCQEATANATSFLEEHLASIVQVQLLSTEIQESRRFIRLSESALRSNIQRRKIELLFGASLYLIIVLGLVVVLVYGTRQVIAGSLSQGSLVAIYGYTLQIFFPFHGVVEIYAKFQRAWVSVQRLLQVIDANQIVIDPPTAVVVNSPGPTSVLMRDVSFGYSEETPVLSHLNLRVEKGEKVAIAGLSGQGKTTIARLLARLYDPVDGVIMLDGVDIRELTLKSLRASLIFVPQEPILFNLSLRENLSCGNTQLSAEELDEVARVTQLGSVIKRLPLGWEQPLGPRGSRLSGGERQRVALARALLKRPKVIVLDEITSALDHLTEEKLLQALHSRLNNVTTIFITHRPLPLKWADRVVFLEPTSRD